MKTTDPRERALYDVLWRVRELLVGCSNLDGSLTAARDQALPLRDAVRRFDAVDQGAPSPDIAPREEPAKLKVIARPDLATCAHGLRRSDCEWCMFSGTAPAPSRAQAGKCGVCGGDPDDRHDGPGHSIHRAAPSGPREGT